MLYSGSKTHLFLWLKPWLKSTLICNELNFFCPMRTIGFWGITGDRLKFSGGFFSQSCEYGVWRGWTTVPSTKSENSEFDFNLSISLWPSNVSLMTRTWKQPLQYILHTAVQHLCEWWSRFFVCGGNIFLNSKSKYIGETTKIQFRAENQMTQTTNSRLMLQLSAASVCPCVLFFFF